MRFANVDDALLQINEPYDPNTGFATADPFLETINLPGVNYLQPSAALVFDNSLFGYVGPVLRPALPAGIRPDARRLAVLPGDGRLPPLRQDRRARSCWRPGRSTSGGSGGTRGEFRIFAGQHRPDPRQHLGLVPAERVPQRQRRQHRDRLRRARPAGRHPDRRRQRGAPVPDPQSVVRPARGVPADRGRAVLRHRARVGRPSTLKWSRESGDDPTRVRTPLQTWACRCGPTCSASPSRGWTTRSRRSGRRSRGSGRSASGRRSKQTSSSDGEDGEWRSTAALSVLARSLSVLSPARPLLRFPSVLTLRLPPRRRAVAAAAACGREPEQLALDHLPAVARTRGPRSVLRLPGEGGGRPALSGTLARPVVLEGRGPAPAGRAASSAPIPSRAWSSRSTPSAISSPSTSRPGGSAPISSRSAPPRWDPTARSTPWTPAAP